LLFTSFVSFADVFVALASVFSERGDLAQVRRAICDGRDDWMVAAAYPSARQFVTELLKFDRPSDLEELWSGERHGDLEDSADREFADAWNRQASMLSDVSRNLETPQHRCESAFGNLLSFSRDGGSGGGFSQRRSNSSSGSGGFQSNNNSNQWQSREENDANCFWVPRHQDSSNNNGSSDNNNTRGRSGNQR
jgi:hypothetical protein